MKTVLVTGGTIRLGKAIADRLRADGWRVVTSSHRADAGADIVADLSEPMGAAKLYAAALQLLGGNPPDALVNNAALFTGDETAVRTVGFEAPKKLTMMMAGREDGMGAVVNLLDSHALSASCCASQPSRASQGYLAAKQDLRAFTLSSALMFAASLRVNAVAPGPVLAPTDVHEKAGETLLARRPTPEDVAAAVAYLLSAEATTGVVLPVDGGQSLCEPIDPLNDPLKVSLDERLLRVVRRHPGVQLSFLASVESSLSQVTVERAVAALVAAGRIEHRGSKKTGGYYAL